MDEHFHQTTRLPKEQLQKLSERSNSPAILRFITLYLSFILASIWVVMSWGGAWWNLIVSQFVFGVLCCSMFAVVHESGHGTAFKSKQLNKWASRLAGLAHFYPPTFFRDFHFTHHRYTHIPGKDPEISLGGKPAPAVLRNLPVYLAWITGLPMFNYKMLIFFGGIFGMPEFFS